MCFLLFVCLGFVTAQSEDDKTSHLDAIKQYPIADSIYRTLQENESGLELIYAVYRPILSTGSSKYFRFELDKTLEKNKIERIEITIFEELSTEDAADYLRFNASLEMTEGFSEFGDEGFITYRSNGEFEALMIRKNKFYVSIDTETEKTAKRIAKYVSDSIK